VTGRRDGHYFSALLVRAKEDQVDELEWARVLDETKAEKNRAVIRASNAEDIIRQLRARVAELETKAGHTCERYTATQEHHPSLGGADRTRA
jgi:hypothetical protein